MSKQIGNPNYNITKYIIEKLITGSYIEKKEISIFKKLFKQFPCWEFWIYFDSEKKTNSLAWFLSKYGIVEVKEKWRQFKDLFLINESFIPDDFIKEKTIGGTKANSIINMLK